MATAESKQILFSKQYCGQLVAKVVKIDIVVKQLIASKTLSEAEKCSLRKHKVADQKFRHLLTIITDHCNSHDLEAFKTFMAILRQTGNTDVVHQILPIYTERVNQFEIISQLANQKSLVGDLKNEISGLQRILEEKKGHIEKLRYTIKNLVGIYCKVANDEQESSREEKMSLEKQINKSKEDLLLIEKEMGELARKIIDLENEVELKSNDIRERNKMIEEKEQKVMDAIEESNSLHLKIDTLQQQHTVKDKEMSKKIEILEDELAEKENTIVDLRKNKTMTWEEMENITKGQTELIKQNSDDMKERVDSLAKGQMAQMTSTKQQNDKIDFLTDTFMKLLKSQEK